jgi:uncharacterized repeat protein (TIGR01451 family)
MNKLKFPFPSRLALAICLGIAALPGAHAQQGSIELKNVAEIEVETKDAQGKIERKRQPVAKAIPGTEVFYTTTLKNVGNKPAGNIVINNPVPSNTTLVAGSVFGSNMEVTYSLDGKTFNAPDKLKVKDKDGKEVTATAADYSAIRWAYKGELAVGKVETAGFRSVIK